MVAAAVDLEQGHVQRVEHLVQPLGLAGVRRRERPAQRQARVGDLDRARRRCGRPRGRRHVSRARPRGTSRGPAGSTNRWSACGRAPPAARRAPVANGQASGRRRLAMSGCWRSTQRWLSRVSHGRRPGDRRKNRRFTQTPAVRGRRADYFRIPTEGDATMYDHTDHDLRLPPGDQAPPSALRLRSGRPRLGDPARSVPALRRGAAGAARRGATRRRAALRAGLPRRRGHARAADGAERRATALRLRWHSRPGSSSASARWALRVNPSSGNLHPTEGYLVCGPIDGLSPRPFVAHYAPREHALELRAVLPAAVWARLAARLPPGALLVGLTSIHWREAWKYGERAFRYCQHDVGHALGALAVAAAALGWRARLLEGPSSAALGAPARRPRPDR